MIVDFIPFAYRGTMRDYNGDLFDVDWYIVTDPAATVMEFTHPFRSMYGDTWRPFDTGAVGEIPQWFPQRSRLKKPSWVCDNCYAGSLSFWQSGWPIGTPGLLLVEGFAAACQNQSFETAASKESITFAAVQSGVFPEELSSKQQVSFASFPSVSSTETVSSKQACTFITAAGSVSTMTASCKERGTFSQSGNAISSEKASSKQSGSFSETAAANSSETASSKEQGVFSSLLTVFSLMTGKSKEQGTFGNNNSMLTWSAASVAATGTTQGGALAITHDITNVTTAAAQLGVILPSQAGVWFIRSDPGNTNALRVYPPSGGNINGSGLNNPDSPGTGQMAMYISEDGVKYCKINPTC